MVGARRATYPSADASSWARLRGRLPSETFDIARRDIKSIRSPHLLDLGDRVDDGRRQLRRFEALTILWQGYRDELHGLPEALAIAAARSAPLSETRTMAASCANDSA